MSENNLLGSPLGGASTEPWVVVLDLDDTLYPESDFVMSGLRACGKVLAQRTGINASDEMVQAFKEGSRESFQIGLAITGEQELTPTDLRAVYQSHIPEIFLPESSITALRLLSRLPTAVAMITDGYSQTQRNKLAAFGLQELCHPLIISEEIGSCKPASQNYEAIEVVYPQARYIYIGDNPTKDFVTAKARGWYTIQVCAHRQTTTEVPPEYRAHQMVDSLHDAILFFENECLHRGNGAGQAQYA